MSRLSQPRCSFRDRPQVTPLTPEKLKREKYRNTEPVDEMRSYVARARVGKMAVRTDYCSPLLGSLSENGFFLPADDKVIQQDA